MGYNTDNESIRWPFGAADAIAPAVFAASMSVTVANRLSVVTLPTLTASATLDVVPSANQLLGDKLVVKVKATTNGYNLTLGSSIDGPVIVGVANKTNVMTFVYDGNAFIAESPAVQID